MKRLWWLLLLALVVLGACRQPPPKGNPALPRGFADTPLPDAPIAAYAYFAQETPLRILPRSLGIEADNAPDGLGLTSAAVWVAPDGETVGGAAIFPDAEQAELVELLLQVVQQSQSDLWTYRSGQVVAVVSGRGEKAFALQEALRQNRGVRLQERYPQAWELIQRLPTKPLGAPVGAGFVLLSKEFLEALGRRTGSDMQGLQQAVGTARVEVIAFALYAKEPVSLDSPLSGGLVPLLERQGMALVGVAKAGLPSLVMRMGAGVALRQAGLEPMQVQGQTVYGMRQGDFHLRLRVQGNLIYGALAPTPQLAEEAIASTFSGKSE